MSRPSAKELGVLAVATVALSGCPIYVPASTVETRPLSAPASSMPQACGQTEASAFYGPVQLGATVLLNRHRAVAGDDNWADGMAPFVGRSASVTELGGVDDVGCPGVRINLDGGQWFWRIRDLQLASAPPAPPSDASGIPRSCGMSAGAPYYGPIQVGTPVVLGRHAAIAGDDNWASDMNLHVGQTAYVTELGGTDEQGCPGVRINLDGGQFFWRIRAMNLGAAPPDACGQASAAAFYGPVRVGSVIRLGRHRSVGGDDNWSAEMNAFMGQLARVSQLSGTDDQGCPGVRIDLDNGQWFWRVRDVQMVQ